MTTAIRPGGMCRCPGPRILSAVFWSRMRLPMGAASWSRPALTIRHGSVRSRSCEWCLRIRPPATRTTIASATHGATLRRNGEDERDRVVRAVYEHARDHAVGSRAEPGEDGAEEGEDDESGDQSVDRGERHADGGDRGEPPEGREQRIAEAAEEELLDERRHHRDDDGVRDVLLGLVRFPAGRRVALLAAGVE